jgi:shikimate dehydrogenase
MNINGSTKVTGIFGYPVEHTLSPQMHNAAFAALRLHFVYVPFTVEPGTLKLAVCAVRSLGLAGVNVTVPYKEKVLGFLDRIDPLARRIGSVNTIVNREGTLYGYNTDAGGFLKDIKEKGFSPKRKRALLIGAGGAARAIAFALDQAGISTLYITSRTAARARRLAKEVRCARYITQQGIPQALADADLIVNATPLGMQADDPSPLATASIEKHHFVYDVVYHRPTRLLKGARAAGARAFNGAGMLLHQGALAFELWTGKKAPVSLMQEILTEALGKASATYSIL